MENFEDCFFQIAAVDRFYHQEGVFSVQARPFAALSFCESGEADFRVGGRRLTVRPGDLLFLPDGAPYEVRYSGGSSLVAHLAPCSLREAASFSDCAFLEPRFRACLEKAKQGKICSLKAEIWEIFQALIDRRAQRADPALERARAYLEAHAFEPGLRLAEACRAGGLSESSLRRRFGEAYGLAPKQLVLRLRLNRALSLLADGRLSVQEVAAQCGFGDEKYFSRLIRARTGAPPRAWREPERPKKPER